MEENQITPRNGVLKFGHHQLAKNFFVLTSGRSGSMAIAHTLAQHSKIHCLHEAKYPLRRLSFELEHGLITPENTQEKIIEIYKRLGERRNICYGESDHKLFNMLPFLRNVVPKAKYLWLIRDGRDVVASTFNRGWYTREDLLTDWGRYRINGFGCGEYTEDEWWSLTRFERNCWYWKYVNEKIHKSLKTIDPYYWFPIHLEYLAENLDEIQKFLGVRREELILEKKNEATYEVVRWQNWTVEQKKAFDTICGECMKITGYY
jgi:hypothetical protein